MEHTHVTAQIPAHGNRPFRFRPTLAIQLCAEGGRSTMHGSVCEADIRTNAVAYVSASGNQSVDDIMSKLHLAPARRLRKTIQSPRGSSLRPAFRTSPDQPPSSRTAPPAGSAHPARPSWSRYLPSGGTRLRVPVTRLAKLLTGACVAPCATDTPNLLTLCESAGSLTWINGTAARPWYGAIMDTDEYLPGAPAPHTGEYHELNMFGTPTGWSMYVKKGDALRPLPRGFKWRHAPGEEAT